MSLGARTVAGPAEAERVAAALARLLPASLRPLFDVAFCRSGSLYEEYAHRLTLEVWTDGTIAGIDAVSRSADILVDELRMFAQLGKPLPPTVERGLAAGSTLPPDKYNMPIEELNLSVRAYNCLKRSGLMTVGQVLEKSEDELLALRNFGRKSYEELRDKLIEMGLLQPPAEVTGDISELMPLQRTLTSGPGEESEDLSPLGAALIEALREAGEDPSDLLRRREREREGADEEL